MRIVPVLDVMNGTVVRAIGGRRSEYRSVASKLTASTEPVEVARALLAATGSTELYVADLDAIVGGGLSSSVGHLLRHTLATVWLDVGLRCPLEAAHLKRFCNVRPVVASETFGGGPPPAQEPFGDILRLRPALSIDLRDGKLITVSSDWSSPQELAERMSVDGFRTFILLDLARVGMYSGPGTEALCQELRKRYPDIELLVGGGVRNRDDLKRLEDVGADGVLVASALHDRTLP